MERILTPREVAEYLRLPLSTIRKYLREGRLRGVKIGKHWRIRERDVEAFLDSMETPPQEKEERPRRGEESMGEAV